MLVRVFNTCYNSNCHKKKPFSKGAGRREAFSMYCAHTELVKCMCVCVKQGEHLNERVRCSTRGRGRLFCCFHGAAGSGSDERCRPLFFSCLLTAVTRPIRPTFPYCCCCSCCYYAAPQRTSVWNSSQQQPVLKLEFHTLIMH